MAKPNLHRFKDDLKSNPGNGSAAPPRTISAGKLDDNFTKVTLLESNESPKAYQVDYTSEGVRIRGIKGLPSGATFREFDVCENGQAVQYWMVTWDEDPS
jgi:hypothetical protein